MTVRFIHAADLHLGSPLQAVAQRSAQVRKQLEEATYTALERIVDAALEYEVDFVTFAGDIYDRTSRSVRANQFFVDQLKRLDEAGIHSYLIYGNHDPLGKHGELVELPPTARVFGSEEPEIALYPSEEAPKARIIGQSYRTPSDDRKMYHRFTPPDGILPNIGVLHSGLDPDATRYAPCSRNNLQAKEDIHYWALGHIHETKTWPGDPYVAFPGIPQGRHATELGVGGCLLVELDPGETDVKFVPTSPIVWLHEPVSIEAQNGSPPPQNVDAIVERMRETASALLDADPASLLSTIPVEPVETSWRPDGFVVRWELTGRGPAHAFLEEAEEALVGLAERARSELGVGDPFVWTETIRQRTAAPLPDLEDVKEEDELLQELVTIVDELSEDEDAREDLRERCRKIWQEPRGHEDERVDRFALTEDRLDAFVDDAEELLVDRILERRSEHVDS